ncbi:lycopene cyclase domain-containing protein [Flavobacterium sp.]|uniref:lycopene cyclase domain-containing protein n=1 Tax=Flavobacterium sp. TaxID=239 RepID=UPI002C3E8B09|nr:lycopene cyclase domain-containing protein [Flavobacterium sp.]HSD09070.1 lycopene cyclase domain-containing protein [Flavobacterium sp.]
MKQYTYLLILIFSVIVCFIASFDKRIEFYKHFGAFLKSALIVAIPFILWDIWFTENGVWWFNYEYTLGINIAGLPIEEWLFFICIPFSCMFTYFCFDTFFKLKWISGFNNIIVFVSIIVCSLVALLNTDKDYTFVTACTTIAILICLHFIVHAPWISQASFVFFVLMLGFFPVNGILTGTGLDSPIVNYNPDKFLGIRMLTIPIEDAVYGYSQFLLVIYFFKMFQKSERNSVNEQAFLTDF